MGEIKIGVTGETTEVVTDNLTANALGSGLVPALATPAMIALMENASVSAIRDSLEIGETSVGIEVNVKHIAATPVGMRVRTRAEVVSVDGRRVTFRVEAWDDREKIGEGTHVRAIVDEVRFKERIAQKQKSREFPMH